MQAQSTPKLLINTHEAAKLLSISEKKLWSMTAPRGPLPCVRMGRAVRYHPADIDNFVAAMTAKV